MKLLLIDPQNDFCDIAGAALPVQGADSDMRRAAGFLHTAGSAIADVTVTLDTHPTVAIERTTFWIQGNGESVAPFTQITEAEVRSGRYRPRKSSLQTEVLTYLHALEGGGRYRLMVWPVHCVLGTWGHNIHSVLSAQLASWEERTQQGVFKVLKGLNPLTEQYSAVRAEVPRADDPRTHGNPALVDRVRPDGGLLFVAGEAASHCVAATVTDLMEHYTHLRNVVLLRDAMSPVSGFSTQTEAFFARSVAAGARLMTCQEALALLQRSERQ